VLGLAPCIGVQTGFKGTTLLFLGILLSRVHETIPPAPIQIQIVKVSGIQT
jgi:hypothetical protein